MKTSSQTATKAGKSQNDFETVARTRFFHTKKKVSLVVAALVLVVSGTYILATQANIVGNIKQDSRALFANNTIEAKENIIGGLPTGLSVPSVGINNLQVAEGIYNSATQQWTLSTDKAHFAKISVQANNTSGNTFIYGHYRPGVFINLKKLKPGDLAVVTTDNGKMLTYKFRQSAIVDPTDSTPFAYQGPSILTLQTCTGAFFQNRQLFIFDFVEVK